MSRIFSLKKKKNGGFLPNAATLLLAFALAAGAQTNPYGRIWETDGVPQDLGNSQLGWTYAVKNQSAGNITSIRFENVFSTTAPIEDVIRSGWNSSATDANNDQLWDIAVSANSNYLPPNQTDFFSFVTTHTSPTQRLLTGPRPGAVMFQGYPGDWYSPDVSGLIGPVGELPAGAPPLVPGLSGFGLNSNTVSLTATNLVWGYGYTLEASSNLVNWTSLPLDANWFTWTPTGGLSVLTFWATNFPTPTGAQPLTFPAALNASAQFYRSRSP